MNTAPYQALVCALESGTLTQAAEQLGYTQSGLTKMLNALERELGFRLLIRDRHGVRLTSEGELLLPLVRTLLNDQQRLDRAVGEIKALRRGRISIGTFNSVSAQWLPGMIREFSARYPQIRFELLHGTNDQIVEWVRSSRLDLGFTKYGSAPDLEDTFLMRDPIVAVFSADDPNAARRSIPLRELAKLPYVALNEGVDDEITDVLKKNNVALHPSFVESDDHAVLAMVEQGLGTSLMSQMMIQGFSHRVAAVPLSPPHYRELGIACRSSRLLSAAAAAFLRHAVDWVARCAVSP